MAYHNWAFNRLSEGAVRVAIFISGRAWVFLDRHIGISYGFDGYFPLNRSICYHFLSLPI